jgi:hypothetical protein
MDEEVSPYPWIVDVEPPEKLMEVMEPTWKELTVMGKATRS